MSNTPQSQITMRIPLDRPPTEADHKAEVGLELFQERLHLAGWVDATGRVLKRFKVSYEGGEEDGAWYIEWKAVLKE